jgi:hypothetical protein
MKSHFLPSLRDPGRLAQRAALGLAACSIFVSCTQISDLVNPPEPEPGPPVALVGTPANFEIALRENQAALTAGKIAPDIGLYKAGFLLAHPANPRRDYPRAIHSFQTLVAQHPRSSLVEPAKTWIQVLEQQQEAADERRRLAEEKRALEREREMLAQERQKLNYAAERSRQLDLKIEKRRRQTLGK